MTSAQADMDRRSPMAEGEDHLSALPIELLVNIVEQLPVQEICRLRLVSRQFRGFVDTNQVLLTQGLVNHHRSRIESEYKLLTDLSDCDIIDALRRYHSHYGLDAESWIRESHICKATAMSQTLHFNWMESHHLPVANEHCEAFQWVRIYVAMSHPGVAARQGEHFSTKAVAKCEQYHECSHGFTNPEAFKAKLAQVASTRVGVAHKTIPCRFITQRKVADDYHGRFKTHQGLVSHWEKSELQQLLDLPDLKSKRGSLAYCISSGETAALIHKAKQGRAVRLKQAAIIEELYIW